MALGFRALGFRLKVRALASGRRVLKAWTPGLSLLSVRVAVCDVLHIGLVFVETSS